MSYDLGVLNLQGQKKKKNRRWLWASIAAVLIVVIGVLVWRFVLSPG